MDPQHESTELHPPTVARVDLSFEPSGKSVRVPTGVSVFDAASWNGIAIDSTCGGHGTCKKCKVQVLEGTVPVGRLDSRAFSADELADGWRLACIANATCDLRIHVPPLTTRPKAATVGVGRQVILRPSVVKRHITMPEPTLVDQRPDSRRVLDEINDLTENIDPHVLRELPRILRANNFDVTAVIVDDMPVAVEPGDTSERLFGIACDLGTTTVVATLLDLSTGTPLAVASMLNKQQPFGADVISRISATMLDPNALDKLQQLAHETLAELAAEVCTESGIDPAEIYEVAIAGNATMTQIALGIDPEPLGVAPFILATETYPTMLASELGFALNPRARAFLFPALGAYVGGDIIAGALATGMDRDKRLRLFIDIGTNCEIVLGDGERLMATAAPAGPAFEAASIKCGMRAAPGAVEVITIDDEGVHLQVIGDVHPVGLCGSGLVDAVAELVRVGIIDASGRYIPEESAAELLPLLAPRLTELNGERIFTLSAETDEHEAVYLSQRDVRELQFAKAAISTGWKLLVEEFGADPADIQQVL
ncbi:MAG: ASKHA domain-containing protein, partial [Actinobacteria bacterium]|nr:ASKHA domain-containing protein [Actinomycetota bacterium]